MNGPREPRNIWAGAENMGLVEPSGLAADTWERFDEAVEAVCAVGADHVVTSLEWARLSPSRGSIDAAVLGRYGDQLELLRASGIHPIVRLGSELVPAWAGEEFWLLPGSPETFVAAMVEIVESLGVNAASWISFTNSVTATIGGWLSGELPPFRRLAIADARLVLDNFLTAHVLLAGELHARGVSSLGLELPALGYEFSGAVGVGLEAARAGASLKAAVAAARPDFGARSAVLMALDPYGVSWHTSTARNRIVAKVLRHGGALRWVTEAERLGAQAARTEVALNLNARSKPRYEPPWSLSVAKPQATSSRPHLLPTDASSSSWFIDEAVANVDNGVVTSTLLSGGLPGYLDRRAKQLSEVAGPVRYTYNALLDGYVAGSFRARTGLFGIDRARGRRGVNWLRTDASGNDAASAFARLAETVRTAPPS